VTNSSQQNTPVHIHNLYLMDQTTALLAIGTNESIRLDLVECRNHNAEVILAAFNKHRVGRVIKRTRRLQIGPASGAATSSVTGGLITPFAA